jgi:hypothetical protein
MGHLSALGYGMAFSTGLSLGLVSLFLNQRHCIGQGGGLLVYILEENMNDDTI